MLGQSTVAALSLLAIGVPLALAAPSEAELAFKDFVTKYDRKYHSLEEEANRFKIFEANFNYINAANARALSYFLVVNEFADQAPEEFNSTHFGLIAATTDRLWKGMPRLGVDEFSGTDLPSSVDWTEKGAVTAVKNQGQCNSCWAFSATGALEGAWQIAAGKLISLSEQQLVDCSRKKNTCAEGGFPDSAFSYLAQHGSCLESSYPYTAETSPVCKEDRTCTVGIPKVNILGYHDVVRDDMNALMEAITKQPVSVGIEANQKAFQHYGGGVLHKECGSKLDHGVLLVGYGTDKGMEYWKVKNSWGTWWGEKGYVRIERGLPGAGKCGIKGWPSYPKVDASVKVFEVTDGTCQSNTGENIYDAKECSDAAASLGFKITWGPHGGYTDVVNGCSVRFSEDLFLNPKAKCDTNKHSCSCRDTQPCLCKMPVTLV